MKKLSGFLLCLLFACSPLLMGASSSWNFGGAIGGFQGSDMADCQSQATWGATTTAPTLGTITSQKSRCARIGDHLHLRYDLTISGCGGVCATGSGNYLFTLPSGYVMDTNKMTVSTADVASGGSNLGTAYLATTTSSNTNSAERAIVVPYDSTRLQISRETGNAANHSAPFSSGGDIQFGLASAIYISIDILVPIEGWNAGGGTVSLPYFQSYHDKTCGWTTSASSYSDYSDDSSCNYTNVDSSGFGSVASYGSNKPGVSFTAPITGKIEVCAQFTGNISIGSSAAFFELYDGTNERGEQMSINNTVNTINLCGIFSVTASSSYDIRIRGHQDGGGDATVGSQGGSSSVRNKIWWTAKYISN